jgi:hypothetical protein
MVEHQKQQPEEYYILEGFEDGNPHFLAHRINNFIKENDIRYVMDVKYSYLKKDSMNFHYSAMLIFKGTKEQRDKFTT